MTVCPPLLLRSLALHCASEGRSGGPPRADASSTTKEAEGGPTPDHGRRSFSGAVYVFREKRTDRIKLVFWDGTGVCLYEKRFEDGEFRWPKVRDGVMRLTAAQLSALLEGLDWRLGPRSGQTRVRRRQG